MRRPVLGVVLVVLGVAVAASFGTAGAKTGKAAKKADWVSNAGDVIAAPRDSAESTSGESASSEGTAEAPINPSSGSETPDGYSPKTGDVGVESIIGSDRRVRVNPTTTYPARATTFITFNQGSGSFSCSGWLISKDTVATAGHCVNTGPSGGSVWSTNVRVYPGRNGSSAPYGLCTAKRLWSVNGWVSSGLETYDYGAIKLNCTIGNTTGWYGFFWQSATLTGTPDDTRGYPGDKPSGTQWLANNCAGSTGFTQCTIAVTQTRQLFYKNDTFGGQSGSPVYYNRSPSCNPCGMAIHAYGLHGSPPHSTNNHGTRITESVFNFLQNIINKP